MHSMSFSCIFFIVMWFTSEADASAFFFLASHPPSSFNKRANRVKYCGWLFQWRVSILTGSFQHSICSCFYTVLFAIPLSRVPNFVKIITAPHHHQHPPSISWFILFSFSHLFPIQVKLKGLTRLSIFN